MAALHSARAGSAEERPEAALPSPARSLLVASPPGTGVAAAAGTKEGAVTRGTKGCAAARRVARFVGVVGASGGPDPALPPSWPSHCSHRTPFAR